MGNGNWGSMTPKKTLVIFSRFIDSWNIGKFFLGLKYNSELSILGFGEKLLGLISQILSIFSFFLCDLKKIVWKKVDI